MFLVYDEKTEIPESDVLGEQTVGTDYHVGLATGKTLERRCLLFRSTETGEDLDSHGEVRQAFDKGTAVLFGEDGGRYQDSDLLARLDRLEGSTDCNLGLAVPNIADQQPVHG